METNLETKLIGADPSERSGEIDQVTIPIWHHSGSAEAENNHEQQIEAGENSGHIITIPEPHMCRICPDNDDENDDILVELGCRCKGQLSRMHRKCILQWYGLRIILEKNFHCELCNTILQVETQLVVARGVADHQNGGRAILINALKSELAPYAAHINVDSASTYHDLVNLLLKENADWFRQRNANFDDDDQVPATLEPECSLAVVLSLGMLAVAAVAYLFVLNHYYGATDLFH